MTGQSILKELFDNLLETKLFKEISHSVVLKKLLTGGVKPVAPYKEDFEAVGIEDHKGFNCYCRQVGPLEVSDIEKVGACGLKIYKTKTLHRLVFFNDNEKRSQDDLTGILTKAVIKTGFINLKSIESEADKILQKESPAGTFVFTNKTYYLAIDFFVLLTLQTDNCEQEISCNRLPNPYCG